VALTALLTAAPAHANTWNFSGVIEFCDALACSLAGIGVGDQLTGFLEANDAASGPNSTFTEADITDWLIATGAVQVGSADSTLDDATVTTDDADEIVAGTLHFSGTFDGGIFGPIDLDVTLDATAHTWSVETPFLGLGLVASGTGDFLHVADDDGDGVPQDHDNCTQLANSDQRDTDGDGFGNVCDADFDNSCSVNFADLGIMKLDFFQSGTTDTDLNGDGATNFIDLGAMKTLFFLAPGPSGVPNVCSPARTRR
jgi:Thrombospondin type 3 repeat